MCVDNVELLFSANQIQNMDSKIEKRLHFDKRKMSLKYDIKTPTFSGDQIFEIICVLNYLDRRYSGQKIPVTFILGKIKFNDKLVYIILECICYYVLIVKRRAIKVLFDCEHTIWSEGITYSPLLQIQNKDTFLKKYFNDLNGRHYRRIIGVAGGDETDLSKMMQDITCFLVYNGVSEKSSDELAEVLIELVGNAREHANAATLIDIDITNTNYTKNNDSSVYYGMNTVILNFSKTLFYEPLKEKLNSAMELSEKYGLVKMAYGYHSKYFSNLYEEKDFYTISSFQDKISGSITKKMGGRGLTTLLKSLEKKADMHLCYMLSGDTALFFIQDLLECDSNSKFVGFNHSADYLTDIPDEKVLQKIKTFFPGTAYNLSFAIKKEWNL